MRINFAYGLLLCFLVVFFVLSDAQNLQDLSYGKEVFPAPKPTTEVPIPSTTKKTGFFKGIKNWFTGDSSSTPPPATTVTKSPTSIGGSNPTSQRDYVNTAITTGPANSPSNQGFIPSSQPSSNSGGSTPTLPTGSGRPSIPFSPTQSNQGITTVQGGGSTAKRDYVNPINGNLGGSHSGSSVQQGNSIPTSPYSIASSTNSPSRRDYVNTNIGQSIPGSSSSQIPISPTQPSNHQTTGQQLGTTSSTASPPRRDYVNTNIGQRNSSPSSTSSSSSPTLPTSAPTGSSRIRQSNGQVIPISGNQNSPVRDYVNTNIQPQPPTGQKLPDVNTPSPSILNKDDFPPLPPPRKPKPSGRPTGTSNVSFIPRQPSGTQSTGGSTTVKPNELATDEEIIALTENLFSKETNSPHRFITVNYQGKTRSSETTDEAPAPLLQVQEQALQSPTIEKLRPLFNNYELDTSVNEHVTAMERKEENDFIDALLATPLMRQAMLFLQNKGIVTPDPKTHRDLLKTIWFNLYSRGGGRIGSSAFEHIFLSEIKNGTVTGLHNWIYYAEEERLGHVDYKGYIKKLDLGNKGAIVKFRFDFNGITKPVNAMFVGTSPELEIALYTVCFQLRADKECPVSLNGNKFILRTYTFRYRGKNLIGSAFPEI